MLKIVKVYGESDDLVEIEGSQYENDEIGCYKSEVRIWFTDGTVIRIGYSKPYIGVWYINVEEVGIAYQNLTVCEDENAYPYSDIFDIDAEILKHEVLRK